jgi:hypothetical protein
VDVVGRLFLDAGDMNYAQWDITADASSIAHRTALAAACEPSTPTITAEADLSIIFYSIIDGGSLSGHPFDL